jgi:hypothetical protein
VDGALAKPKGITVHSKRLKILKKFKRQITTTQKKQGKYHNPTASLNIKFNNANNNSSPQEIPVIDPLYPNIFNIAKAKLSIHEKQILSKGLKCCPTPKKANASQYEMAIKDLHRKILIQGYYLTQDPITDQSHESHMTLTRLFKSSTKSSQNGFLRNHKLML